MPSTVTEMGITAAAAAAADITIMGRATCAHTTLCTWYHAAQMCFPGICSSLLATGTVMGCYKLNSLLETAAVYVVSACATRDGWTAVINVVSACDTKDRQKAGLLRRLLLPGG
jgi:hypothetical protein